MRRFIRRLCIGFLQLLAAGFLLGASGAAIYESYRHGGTLAIIGAAVMVFFLVFVPSGRKIPTLKIGMVTFLGMRTGRVLEEGFHLIIPWFEDVALFDNKVRTVQVSGKFFCKDNLSVVLGGLVTWNNDKELLPTSFVMNQEKIDIELASVVLNQLAIIAGATNAADIKGAQEAFGHLVNCSLRMGIPPHIEQGILPAQRLEFYGNPDLHNRLESEHRLDEERSEIENRCGVNVISFTPDPVQYIGDTGEAMEEEGRAALRSRAKKVLAATKREISRDLRGDGLTPDGANASAELTMGQQVERKVYDIGGLDKFRPLLPPESCDYRRIECLNRN